MAKKPPVDLDRRIVEAAMMLFAERGYADVRLIDIANVAECDLGALRLRLSDKIDIMALFLRQIDGAVLAVDSGYDPEESVRDRLFDLLMRRFDALQPYRPALRAVSRDLRRDIPALLSFAPAASGALGWYLEAAGTSADGIIGGLRVKGLALVWLRCLKVWFEDDSDDLAKTMATLDKALTQAEKAATWLSQNNPRGSGRHHTPSDDPQAETASGH